MDGYLSKPFSVVQLFDQLTPWLSLPRQHSTINIEANNNETLNNPSELSDKPIAVDVSALDKIASLQSGSSNTLINKVISLYLKTLNESLAIFHDVEPNYEMIRKSAHTLKSSSANVGAVHLAKLANHLEQAIISDATSSVSLLIDEIEIESKRVISYFRDKNDE